MEKNQNISAPEQTTNGGAEHFVSVHMPDELSTLGESERVAVGVMLEAIVKALLAILFRKK